MRVLVLCAVLVLSLLLGCGPMPTAVSDQSEQPTNNPPQVDPATASPEERAKAACALIAQEGDRPILRSRLLGIMHQMSVASERRKWNFEPGEARYLCGQYIRLKNQRLNQK